MERVTDETTEWVDVEAGDHEDISQLATAIALAASEIGAVPKSGKNVAMNYRYSTDADIMGAVRGPMAKHGLSLLPIAVDDMVVTVETKKGQKRMTTLDCRFLLVHKSGQSVSLAAKGSSIDTEDKGIYKAMTGATKYLYRSLFSLACGDDPEGADPGHGAQSQGPSPADSRKFALFAYGVGQAPDAQAVNSALQKIASGDLAEGQADALRRLASRRAKELGLEYSESAKEFVPVSREPGEDPDEETGDYP